MPQVRKYFSLAAFFAFERILGKAAYGVYVVMKFDVTSIATTKPTEFCAVIQNSDVTLDITTNIW